MTSDHIHMSMVVPCHHQWKRRIIITGVITIASFADSFGGIEVSVMEGEAPN